MGERREMEVGRKLPTGEISLDWDNELLDTDSRNVIYERIQGKESMFVCLKGEEQ